MRFKFIISNIFDKFRVLFTRIINPTGHLYGAAGSGPTPIGL